MNIEPIGVFRCEAQYSYDAPRQAVLAHGSAGRVELQAGQHFELALRNLDGFDRIWLIYQFDRNTHWKPLVSPPRAGRKVGVFASRAPYRPNAIGLSCVALLRVEGLVVHVGENDLLDGTPILDIKPYLPYADSFPEAACGWVDALTEEGWTIEVLPDAERKLAWLDAALGNRMRVFLRVQLRDRPFDMARKRIRALGSDRYEIAYRTWRARYRADEAAKAITVEEVYSGYTNEQRAYPEDRYADKALHRAFVQEFGGE